MSVRRSWQSSVAAAVCSAAIVLLAQVPSAAFTYTRVVQLPCTHPAATTAGVLPNGTCGYKLTPIKPGPGFRLHPHVPADLDVYFYTAAGAIVGLGTAGADGGCGDVASGQLSVGNVPASAAYAVVVSNVSECGFPGPPNLVNITFTYTDNL